MEGGHRNNKVEVGGKSVLRLPSLLVELLVQLILLFYQVLQSSLLFLFLVFLWWILGSFCAFGFGSLLFRFGLAICCLSCASRSSRAICVVLCSGVDPVAPVERTFRRCSRGYAQLVVVQI